MNASLSLPGFSSPAAGPDEPLAMLSACHTRVEKQCRTLERLQDHLPVHGPDGAAREAADAVLRYFRQAAPHHHADEEDNLFPALLDAMAGSDAVCIRELTESLRNEHRQLEARWSRLEVTLSAIAQGLAHRLDSEEVRDFVQAYRGHIEREDHELLPMAERLLGDEALLSMGEAMRKRRGIT